VLTAVLVLLVVLPALGAAIVRMLPGRAARGVAGAASGVAAVLAVAAVAGLGGGVHRAALGDLPWLRGLLDGPAFGVLLDPLASILLLLACSIGFLAVLYSTAYLRERNREHGFGEAEQGRYYFWLLLFVASMAGIALSPNLLQLLFFWEMTTACSWALISFRGNATSLRAGYKALLLTHAGGLCLALALLVVFVETGSFEFAALARLAEPVRGRVFLLLMVAAWAKAAQVPFQTWLPDAMEAPTPVSAYLHAAAMVKAGVYLMARTASAGWAMPAEAAAVLGAMALLTVFVALSYYFVQDDLKRLLAWSTIAHLGYVLLGVALGGLGSVTGFRGGALHLFAHGVSKAALFLCVGAVAYVTGTRSIAALGGVARSMPLTATAFFVGVLAVTGIPPFACFWSKLMLLEGAVKLPGPLGPLLVGLVLVESLISFGWMLHVGQKVFFGAVTPAACVNSDPPWPMSAALVILMVGCLLAPAIAMPLVNLIGGGTP
jgi:hydrogenase-4 component D